MITPEQIKELDKRREELHTHLRIEDRRLQLDEEQSRTEAPDFWDDPAKAEQQLKKVAAIKYWITAYDEIVGALDDLQLMPEFVREGISSETSATMEPFTGNN